MHEYAHFRPELAERLNNPRRLETQVGEADLARLLALKGDEDLLDLGSGTGFYTDRMAALTSGTVYAVEMQPEIARHHRERGLPPNVTQVQGDITRLSLHPAIADVAVCIAVYHEVGGRLDLLGIATALRPAGRLLIIDWRADPESWEGGPPADIRFAKEDVVLSLPPYFKATLSENLGRFMFAVVGVATSPNPPGWDPLRDLA
jgi:SAM-dependent methyltransferase